LTNTTTYAIISGRWFVTTRHPSRDPAARAFAQPSGLAPTGGHSSRLLRYRVPPAFGAGHHRPALGGRLEGRTGNLPSSGLSPDQYRQLVRLHPNVRTFERFPVRV